MKGDLTMIKMREDLFNRLVPIRIFLKISEGNSYMHKIQKSTGVTYAHIKELIKKFEKWDLIKKEKKGRVMELTLTTKGKDISNKLNMLMKKLNEADQKVV